MSNNSLYRQIPKMDELLHLFDPQQYKRDILKFCINKILATTRKNIASGYIGYIDKTLLVKQIQQYYSSFLKGSLEEIINATGIVIHTNLGRAPLPQNILTNISEKITGYSNLEYDLNKGSRGDRYHHLSEYLEFLTGAESAVILNNNAAAVFLILNTFAKEKECLVSRGELVEIGGSFRIPEVMSNSGAFLKEVGTTNKTKISDYENAVSDKTAMIMKVHKSNYVIKGFTEEPSLSEITQKAKQMGIFSYYDLGSGILTQRYNTFCDEKDVKKIVDSDFDLISFSGDKLLGGVQAGIVLGRKHLVDKLKQNQLMRMLRVDKITLAVLQEILRMYVKENEDDITTINLLNTSNTELGKKAEELKKIVESKISQSKISIEIEDVITYTGGGSCPMQDIHSKALVVKNIGKNISSVENNLRQYNIPIICRVSGNKLYFDVRTIFEKQFHELGEGLVWALRVS